MSSTKLQRRDTCDTISHPSSEAMKRRTETNKLILMRVYNLKLSNRPCHSGDLISRRLKPHVAHHANAAEALAFDDDTDTALQIDL